MLWQEIHGTLHLVFDSQVICRFVQSNRTICTTCQEIYQVAGLQLKAIWQNKLEQLEKSERKSITEPISNVKTVEEKISHLESQSTTVNLEEWVERRKKKSTMPQTSSSYAEPEQQAVTAG